MNDLRPGEDGEADRVGAWMRVRGVDRLAQRAVRSRAAAVVEVRGGVDGEDRAGLAETEAGRELRGTVRAGRRRGRVRGRRTEGGGDGVGRIARPAGRDGCRACVPLVL